MAIRLYQAEWCPFSHRVRAKLTELGVDFEAVNVPASSERRDELEKVAGTRGIPVLVDGETVISDSGEAISYLERNYDAYPDDLALHRRELSPTVYGTLPFGVEDAVRRLRGALERAGVEVVGDLDLSSHLDVMGAYRVLIAVDREFVDLAARASRASVALALLKISVYEDGDVTRVDAVEPEKGAGQIRDPRVNDRGLDLRKLLIRTVKDLGGASS